MLIPTNKLKLNEEEIEEVIIEWSKKNPFLVDMILWIEEKSGFWKNYKEGSQEAYTSSMQKYIKNFEIGQLRTINKADFSEEIPQAMKDRWEVEQEKFIEEVDKKCYEWEEVDYMKGWE